MYYFVFGLGLTTLLPFLFSVFVSSSLLITHLTRNISYAVYTQIACIIYITTFIQWSIGGVFDSGFVMAWATCGPIGALIFFPFRKSVIWFLLYLVNVVITVVFDDFFASHGQVVEDGIRQFFFVMNLGFSSTVVFAFAGYFVAKATSERRRADALLLNTLPAEIVRVLKSGRKTIAEHYETSSILFCDIVGSTPLFSGMAPEEVVDWLNEIFSGFDQLNAALRNIVRRDTGEGYRGMLERLAQESGIETPTAEDLARLDRKRKGKKLSNQDWVSRSDPEAKIAKMKDGTTHLAYKPEHAVDLDTGAVVAAELHPADEGDTTTLPKTLAAAEANLEAVDVAPTAEDPAECVTDKGYHSRLVLKALDDGPWKSRISEPKQKGFARWHGDDAARRAVTNNRTRLLSGVAREAFKLRAEIVERSFAHNLDRGGMRRTWLRGRENVHKRYLLHVAGHNLSLLMRQLIGAGTPKEAVAGGIGALFVLVTPAGAVLVVQIVLIVSEDGETAFAAICFAVA